MIDIPMPNDKLLGGTVIASQYTSDTSVLVIILMPNAPFYRLSEIDLINGKEYQHGDMHRIDEAVRVYDD